MRQPAPALQGAVSSSGLLCVLCCFVYSYCVCGREIHANNLKVMFPGFLIGEYVIAESVCGSRRSQELNKTSIVNGINSVTLVLELLRAEKVLLKPYSAQQLEALEAVQVLLR